MEQDAVGRLGTVRLTRLREPANPVVDLLFASSGIEREIVAEADTIELLPQLHVRVATTAHLIALKVLARDDMTRPQDIGDLRALLRAASAADIGRARLALGLIAQRGCLPVGIRSSPGSTRSGRCGRSAAHEHGRERATGHRKGNRRSPPRRPLHRLARETPQHDGGQDCRDSGDDAP